MAGHEIEWLTLSNGSDPTLLMRSCALPFDSWVRCEAYPMVLQFHTSPRFPARYISSLSSLRLQALCRLFDRDFKARLHNPSQAFIHASIRGRQVCLLSPKRRVTRIKVAGSKSVVFSYCDQTNVRIAERQGGREIGKTNGSIVE